MNEDCGEKLGDFHSNTLSAIQLLARLYMTTDRPAEAESLARKTLEKIPSDGPENKRSRATLNDIIRKAERKRGEVE